MGSAVTDLRAPASAVSTDRPAPGETPGRPAAAKRRARGETLAGYLFMSPWIAGFLLLTAGPMLASLYLAFTDYNLFDTPNWIGFKNFTEMFGDAR